MENKFFKRTLLGAAIATAAVAGSANAAIPLAGDAVQFYGQAAGFMLLASDTDSDKSAGVGIESRIGFRGVVEFEDFGPNFIWQIEGGDANNGAKSGQLGARDTYLGLDFEGVGSFKFGRQLVAAYNYVDWPHTNPGLGNVFDWNNDIKAGYQDRADNNFRFDSATFGGFNVQTTLSGMEGNTDQLIVSIAGSYTKDMVSVHAGYYTQGEYKATISEVPKYIINDDGQLVANPDYVKGGELKTYGANSYAIVGGSLFLDNVTLTAAYKMMEQDDEKGVTAKQDAVSATAQYVLDGKWVFKGGYAMTTDAKIGSVKQKDTSDTAVTARLGYLLPSTYLYIDSRNYKMDNNKDWTNSILVGAEYYF